MGRLLNTTVSGALILGLIVSGCGNSGSKSQSSATASASQTSSTPKTGTTATAPGSANTQTSKSTPKEKGSNLTIELSSPVFKSGSAIPAQYTCDGANESPPMKWPEVPKSAKQLALFIVDLAGHESHGEPPVYWAVVGLKPTLRNLSAGTVPAGAIVGRNSLGQNGYSICPPKGSTQNYTVAMYGLPHPLAAHPGMPASTLLQMAANDAEGVGFSGFSYKRA